MILQLIGDLHLRDDAPRCRQDAGHYRVTQLSKLMWAFGDDHGADVFVQAGDFFHRWNPSLELVNTVCRALMDKDRWKPVVATVGQHDLPNHRFDLLDKSGLGLLYELNYALSHYSGAGDLLNIVTIPWGGDLKVNVPPKGKAVLNVGVLHAMVFLEGRPPFPGVVGYTPQQLYSKLGHSLDLLVTGDNHQTFCWSPAGDPKKPWLINPGCLIRQASDMKHHQPVVYLYNTETRKAEAVPVPIKIEDVADGNGKPESELEAFVDTVDDQTGTMVDFRQMVEEHLNKTQPPAPVREAVMSAMEVEE